MKKTLKKMSHAPNKLISFLSKSQFFVFMRKRLLRQIYRGRNLFLRRTKKIVIWIFSLIIITLLIILGYFFNWTGFGQYTSSQGEIYRAKTLWDWMQLLIVPIVLAGGALWFNNQERKAQDKLADQRSKQDHLLATRRVKEERLLADNRAAEEAIQNYLDRMTELLLEQNLRDSGPGAVVRNVARSRTLTVLRVLDGARKGIIIRFLYESELIFADRAIIDLDGADLIDINLTETILREINLKGALMMGANLDGANLAGANLCGADLRGSRLTRTALSNASMKETELGGADLRWCLLNRADLTRASFLWRQDNKPSIAANLSWAMMYETNLENTFMPYAQMLGVDMTGAKLLGTTFRNANLFAARLFGSTIEDVDIRGANLDFVSLRSAKINKLNIADAASSLGIIMPDGSRHF